MLDKAGYLSDKSPEYDKSDLSMSENIIVIGCGLSKLIKRKDFWVSRPKGRSDYQILYIANGAGYFNVENEEKKIANGNIVLYRPHEPQKYKLVLEDAPEVYWIHFQGSKTHALLDKFGILNNSVHYVGIHGDFSIIFEKIIVELQLKKMYFSEYSNSKFIELLTLFARGISEQKVENPRYYDQIFNAVELFHQNLDKEISIKDYAHMCGMSPGWFSKCFRMRFSVSPQEYITNLRLKKAKELLDSSSYNVTEIAMLCGYNNPFYFSRIFKEHTGLSPSKYRNK